MKIINATPHDIIIFPQDAPSRLRAEGGKFYDPETGREVVPLLVIPRSGEVLRMQERDEEGDPILLDGVRIPVVLRLFEVPPIPSGDPETMWIVSLPIAQAWAREYVAPEGIYVPDTGSGAVRDEKGNIVGTRRLIRVLG
jgi:hypothetical protein